MASINASTSGGGGVITTADSSGNLNIQSGGSTVVAVTSTGATVTGTLAATGAVSGTTGTFTSTLGVTGAITGSSTVAGSTGILYPLTSGTAVASTSGTSIDFTGIPSWVKRITVMLSGVSASGTSTFTLQLGDSGGIETSGYAGGCLQNGTQTAWASSAMLLTRTSGNAQVTSTQSVLTLLGSNQWVLSSTMYSNESVNIYMGVSSGTKTLSGTLDRVRITTTNGTDTFDAGSINILYE